ncbi:MAG: hypothetical protein ABH884_01690 [Candidatus Komeilibacteria bacterium]
MVVFMTITFVWSQTATIDLSKLDGETAAQVLAAQKQAQAKLPDIPPAERVEEWVSIGEQVGKAIASTCRELSVEVNEFVKTPVGKLTMFLIVWKVIGEDLWDIVGGCLVWLIVTICLFFSVRHFHMNERVVTGSKKAGTKEVKYVSRYDFDAGNEGISGIFHAVAFCVITIICLIIVF